jgi:hypothetical protein
LEPPTNPGRFRPQYWPADTGGPGQAARSQDKNRAVHG